jgi:hypothetical protein
MTPILKLRSTLYETKPGLLSFDQIEILPFINLLMCSKKVKRLGRPFTPLLTSLLLCPSPTCGENVLCFETRDKRVLVYSIIALRTS